MKKRLELRTLFEFEHLQENSKKSKSSNSTFGICFKKQTRDLNSNDTVSLKVLVAHSVLLLHYAVCRKVPQDSK